MTTYEHIPVLLKEVIWYLSPGASENFIDATLGGGGYTSAILEKNQPGGRILAIDLDQDAIEHSKSAIRNPQSVIFHKGNFSHIDKIAAHHKFNNVSGIVADIGLSSYELENRGISFQEKQPLDMRFDQSQQTDAKFILNNYDETRLRKIFEDYGEEKFSRQIAYKITDYRLKIKEIHYTDQLYQIIQDALPKPVKHKADDSARRVFQALRIEVNHELQNLEEFLPKAFDLLKPGGRLVVVSFHSLEDRIVKQFFVKLSQGCVCPIDFPQCICGKNPTGRILTKKLVSAGAEELEKNPRSKPAKLRAIIKI
jgi:16S rRNA (cytosine1402-N4)-methyltransferase